MKLWIARDKHHNGGLALYMLKPVLNNIGLFVPDVYDSSILFLSDLDPIGKDITFENSPKLIELVRID